MRGIRCCPAGGEPFLLSVSPASFRRRRKAKAYCSISYLLLSHRESPSLPFPPSPLPMPSDGQLRRGSGRAQDKLWVAHTSSSSCTRKGGRRKQRGEQHCCRLFALSVSPSPPFLRSGPQPTRERTLAQQPSSPPPSHLGFLLLFLLLFHLEESEAECVPGGGEGRKKKKKEEGKRVLLAVAPR